MKPLESRKQLLIVESELNRAQLVQEWQTMNGEFHSLARQTKTIFTIASTAVSLFAGLSFLRPEKSEPALKKPSWWQLIFQGAGQAVLLWSELGLTGRDRTGK